jgi:hypothetical protein
MFADKDLSDPTPGYSGSFGCYVFVPRVWDATYGKYDFHFGLAATAAHEVTHLLLNEYNTNGFDDGEHLPDPDEDGVRGDEHDKKFLMYYRSTSENWTEINFSMPTRRCLNLTSKESVER